MRYNMVTRGDHTEALHTRAHNNLRGSESAGRVLHVESAAGPSHCNSELTLQTLPHVFIPTALLLYLMMGLLEEYAART